MSRPRVKLDADSGIPCEGRCGELATSSDAIWRSKGHLEIRYWCRGCAPPGSEAFVDEDGYFMDESEDRA